MQPLQQVLRQWCALPAVIIRTPVARHAIHDALKVAACHNHTKAARGLVKRYVPATPHYRSPPWFMPLCATVDADVVSVMVCAKACLGVSRWASATRGDRAAHAGRVPTCARGSTRLFMCACAQRSACMSRVIVLLHGFGTGPYALWPLLWYLRWKLGKQQAIVMYCG